MKKNIIIAPSVLSANYLNLNEDLDKLIHAGINWIHFDVMDGDFVPNLSFGPVILEAITRKHNFFIDCHMMVKIKNKTLEDYFKGFLDAGANSITMHIESLNSEQIKELINLKNKYKIKIGLAIKPNTDIKTIKHLLDKIDMVLVMTVEPGFGGQSFMSSVVTKISQLRKIIVNNRYSCLIQVDGGINHETANICIEAGADVLVAGSYLFKQTKDNFNNCVKELQHGSN